MTLIGQYRRYSRGDMIYGCMITMFMNYGYLRERKLEGGNSKDRFEDMAGWIALKPQWDMGSGFRGKIFALSYCCLLRGYSMNTYSSTSLFLSIRLFPGTLGFLPPLQFMLSPSSRTLNTRQHLFPSPLAALDNSFCAHHHCRRRKKSEPQNAH